MASWNAKALQKWKILIKQEKTFSADKIPLLKFFQIITLTATLIWPSCLSKREQTLESLSNVSSFNFTVKEELMYVLYSHVHKAM